MIAPSDKAEVPSRALGAGLLRCLRLILLLVAGTGVCLNFWNVWISDISRDWVVTGHLAVLALIFFEIGLVVFKAARGGGRV